MSEIFLPHHHDEQNVENLLPMLSDAGSFDAAADIFKLLGDSSRLRIFWLLCHCEECVINISAMMDMTSPAVSHHLRQLKAYGLVVSKRNGKEVCYRASDTEQSRLLHLIIEKTMEIACPALPDPPTRELPLCQPAQAELAKQVHEYMLENLMQRITIEELSKRFHVNTSTLKEVFKAVYGGSIASHMKEHRLEEAARLLLETDQSIAQIAKSVGYESQSKFSIAFKEMYHVLPTEYRKGKRQ